jgi:hypothetical protein
MSAAAEDFNSRNRPAAHSNSAIATAEEPVK